MEGIRFFNSIRTPYSRSLIYTRLGYKKTSTRLEGERKKQIDKWITEAEEFCELSVIYRIVEITVVEDMTIFDRVEKIASLSLAGLLRYSDSAVLMAATAGSRITNEINRLQESGEMAKALVYDAAASEITDAGLDWLTGFLRQQMIRRGRTLTSMRYSPGYGDLGLPCQKIFYDMLNLKKWGIELNEKYILIPEKTVTAIVGIEIPKN